MNKLTSLLIAGATAVAVGVSSASAQEPLGVDVSFGYSTDYIFRGVDFGSDLIDIDVSYGGALTEDINYGVGVWFATADSAEELNLYGSLDWELLGLGWETGAVFYRYPNTTGTDDDYEVYFSGSTAIAGVDVSATIINNQVGGEVEENLAELSAGYTYDCSWTNRAFDLGVTYGFSITDEPSSIDEYTEVSASTDFAVGTATLTPYIAYVNGTQGVDDVIGGAYLGFTF